MRLVSLVLLAALARPLAAGDPPAPPAPPVAPAPAPATTTAAELEQAAFDRAATYSRQHGGLALLVQRGGTRVYESYTGERTAETAHRLASGTKSFWGVLAVAAAEDGLLTLDEKVSDTLPEWRADARKSAITIRHLLSLTSGLEPAARELQNPLAADKYGFAVGVAAVADPGTLFRYGPAPYYVFGEVLRRKLAPKGEDPLAYLTRRILAPIGLTPAAWSRDGAGHPDLPHGAQLTAREWAKFGELLRRKGTWEGRAVVKPESLAQCFVGSAANPAYGLTFWLPSKAGTAPLGAPRGPVLDGPPADAVAAAGLGGQKLIVIPSQELVVVVQAEHDREFDEGTFWRLFSGRTTEAPPAPARAPRAGTGGERLRRYLASLDKDGDGKISLDEAPPLLAQRFEVLDKDLDGLLTPDELRAALAGG